jgi:large subunit ribosomal protein L22
MNMETAQATLNNYRQSPRKMRLVANFMRGKKAVNALDGLNFLDKRAAAPLKKLLESALSNAKNLDIPTEELFIREITVNGGATLYRRMPAPHGRAMMIRKKTSKITLVLGEKAGRNKKLAHDASKSEIAASKTPVEKTDKPKAVRKPKAAPKKAAK